MLNLQQGDFSKGLKNEFETAVVNEPSVFEPLKFYCMHYILHFIFFVLVFFFCISYFIKSVRLYNVIYHVLPS